MLPEEKQLVLICSLVQWIAADKTHIFNRYIGILLTAVSQGCNLEDCSSQTL